MATFADMINGTPQMMGPGAGSGQIGQVVNPLSQNTGLDQSPPKDEADLQQRVTGWQGFMEQLKTDPVLRNTMMTVGAHLLSGPQFMGENTGSIFGRAIQNGLLTHQLGRAHQEKGVLAKKQEARADATAQAQIAASEANAENVRQKTASDKETLPLTKRKKLAEISQAEMQAENAPKLLQSSLDTAASVRAKNYALANRANRPAGEGSPSTTSELSRLYEIANPGADAKTVAQMVLDHNKKNEKSGGTTDTAKLNTLRALYENADPGSAEAEMYQGLLHDALGLEPGGGKETSKGESPITEEEFRTAAKKAGPDGKFKLRGKTYTLKAGVNP